MTKPTKEIDLSGDNTKIKLIPRDAYAIIASIVVATIWISATFIRYTDENKSEHQQMMSLIAEYKAVEIEKFRQIQDDHEKMKRQTWTVGMMSDLYASLPIWTNHTSLKETERRNLIGEIAKENR